MWLNININDTVFHTIYIVKALMRARLPHSIMTCFIVYSARQTTFWLFVLSEYKRVYTLYGQNTARTRRKTFQNLLSILPMWALFKRVLCVAIFFNKFVDFGLQANV